MAKPHTTNENVTYSEAYKTKCMTAWYAAGRPDRVARIMEVIPEDEFGRKPNRNIIPDWRDEQGWDVWADALDAQAMIQVENELVGARVLMLKEQASRARELQTKGLEYLREHNFDSSSSAVTAVIHGAKLERTSRGISERLEKLLTMDDDSLTREALKLLGQAKESGETLDLEAEDIEDVEESDD